MKKNIIIGVLLVVVIVLGSMVGMQGGLFQGALRNISSTKTVPTVSNTTKTTQLELDLPTQLDKIQVKLEEVSLEVNELNSKVMMLQNQTPSLVSKVDQTRMAVNDRANDLATLFCTYIAPDNLFQCGSTYQEYVNNN